MESIGGSSSPRNIWAAEAGSSTPYGSLITFVGQQGDSNQKSFGKDWFLESNPRSTLLTGTNLNTQWNNITNAMTQIRNNNLTYKPVSQNSNSAWCTAALAGGISTSAISSAIGLYIVPGCPNILNTTFGNSNAFFRAISTTQGYDSQGNSTVTLGETSPNGMKLLDLVGHSSTADYENFMVTPVSGQTYASVSGNGAIVNQSGININFAAGTLASVVGNNNTAQGSANSSLTLSGSGNSLNLSGLSNTVWIGGNGKNATNANDDIVRFLNGQTGTVTALDNSRVEVYGSGCTLYAGNNDLAGLYGSGNTINVTGANSDICTGGNGQNATNANQDIVRFLNGNSGLITALDNSRVGVYGSGCTLYAGNNDLAGLYGSANTINVTGAGNIICAGGNGQNATNANNNYVNFAQGGYLSLLDNSRVDAKGNGVTVNIGNNDTFGLVGGNNTINVSGINNNIWMSNNTINIANNANATIYGTQNKISGGANSTATLKFSDGSFTIYTWDAYQQFRQQIYSNTGELIAASTPPSTSGSGFGSGTSAASVGTSSGSNVTINSISASTKNADGSTTVVTRNPNGTISTKTYPPSSTSTSTPSTTTTTPIPFNNPGLNEVNQYAYGNLTQPNGTPYKSICNTRVIVTPIYSSVGGITTITGSITSYVTDPIILNLQGKSVETQSLSNSSTYFDMQNNGQAVQTGWATAGEGMLVYNPSNPDGAVTQDSQLVAGFSVLQSMDSNHDSVFNNQDQAWQDMRIWITDGTGNFKTDQLHSLDQLGITSINLTSKHVNQDSNGNTILDDSTFTWANGTLGDIAGVDLAFNPNAVQSQPIAATDTALSIMNGLNQLVSAMAFFAPSSAMQTHLLAAHELQRVEQLTVAH